MSQNSSNSDSGMGGVFPEEANIRLLRKYAKQLSVHRVDLYMVYDVNREYDIVLTNSSEISYAINHRTHFSIAQDGWFNERAILGSMPEVGTFGYEKLIPVNGKYVDFSLPFRDPESRANITTGPVAIVRLVDNSEIKLDTEFAKKIKRQVSNTLWQSRSDRLLQSTLELQKLLTIKSETEFIQDAQNLLLRYLRAKAVFTIQRINFRYEILSIATHIEDKSLKEGLVLPKNSVFLPKDQFSYDELYEEGGSCAHFDNLILGEHPNLYTVRSCEVPAADSLLNLSDDNTHEDLKNIPILHICVAGKENLEFEYQFFSVTDKAILAQVSRAIAAHLNPSKLAVGYRKLNRELISSKPGRKTEVAKSLIASDLPDKIDLKVFGKYFENLVQNVGNFFVAVKASKGIELIEGDERYFRVNGIDQAIKNEKMYYEEMNRYVNIVHMFKDAHGKDYYVCYTTLRRAIAHYKAELIRYVINEYRTNFREHLELENRISLMAQFQHATKGPLAAAVSALTMLNVRATQYESNPRMLVKLSQTLPHREALGNSIHWIEKSRQLGEFAQILVEGYGPEKVRWTDGNIVELVNSSVELFSSYAKSRKKGIYFEENDELKRRIVSYDRRAIEVVVHNLIDNAIKYGHRSRSVEVSVWEDVEASEWEFNVTDYGERIPEADAEAIFGVYQRSTDSRVTRQRSGMGLGLAICREILDAHYKNNQLGFIQDDLSETRRLTKVTFRFRMPLIGKGYIEHGEKIVG